MHTNNLFKQQVKATARQQCRPVLDLLHSILDSWYNRLYKRVVPCKRNLTRDKTWSKRGIVSNQWRTHRWIQIPRTSNYSIGLNQLNEKRVIIFYYVYWFGTVVVGVKWVQFNSLVRSERGLIVVFTERFPETVFRQLWTSFITCNKILYWTLTVISHFDLFTVTRRRPYYRPTLYGVRHLLKYHYSLWVLDKFYTLTLAKASTLLRWATGLLKDDRSCVCQKFKNSRVAA